MDKSHLKKTIKNIRKRNENVKCKTNRNYAVIHYKVEVKLAMRVN